ncbi:MAG: transglycosylase family protein [Acidimicrobiales bacterium]
MRVPFRRPDFLARSSFGRPSRGGLLATFFAVLTVAMLTAAGTVRDDGGDVETTGAALSPPTDGPGSDPGADGTGRASARSIDDEPAAPSVDEPSGDDRPDPASIRDQLALSAVVARAGTNASAPATTEAPTTTEAPEPEVTAAPETTDPTMAPETTEATAAESPDTTVAPETTEVTVAAESPETTAAPETTAPAETTTPPETTATAAAPAGSEGWVDSGNGVLLPPVLLAIRRCESTDNYQAANPRSSARGAYQFLTGSWDAYGHRDRYGVNQAHLATNAQQDEAALITWQRDGTRPWAASRSCWS